MSKTKRKKLRDEGNTYNTKTMVMGMLERGGELKLIPINGFNSMASIQPTVKDNVDKDAVLITDSLATYTGLSNDYAGHEVVNHTEQEYVRDRVIHTNSIEGAFSLLKRSIIGIYHQVTPKHLSRYCDETMYRYNLRKMTDGDRFKYCLTHTEGRLTWNALVNKKPVEAITPAIEITIDKGLGVCQIKNGKVIGTFESIYQAEQMTGIDNIGRVLSGKRKMAGGYNWKYVS